MKKEYKIPTNSNATKKDREHFERMNARYMKIPLENIKCDHDLTKIAYKFREFTDKSPDSTYWRKHCYTEFYGPVLAHMQNKHMNILEIGVRWGGSLLMWAEYFQNSKIFGIDIDLNQIKPAIREKIINHDRIIILEGNGYDENFVKNEFADIKFDIILDDGSHSTNDQVRFFEIYTKFLEKDGFIFSEDFPTYQQAMEVILQFNGKINNMSLITRNHCIPSGKGEIIIMYKE